MERRETYQLHIPDDDIPGWMKVLHESGFSFEEIDKMFINLNETWENQRMNDLVKKALLDLDEELRKKRGIGILPEEKEFFKKAVEDGIRSKTRKI